MPRAYPIGRRELLAGLAVSAGIVHRPRSERASGSPRLAARPGRPTRSPEIGIHPLALGGRRDGLLSVPESYRPDTTLPLVVLLHGAGQSSPELLRSHADEVRRAGLDLLLLATDSRAPTWDAIRDDFGPDVEFLDRALRLVFERCAVDPARISMAGFSDGATYALGLGRANGDLISRIVAYSPGFLIPVEAVKRPAVFITHGTRDRILSVEVTRRKIVPNLRLSGYDVEFREWEGGHRIPPELLREAVGWMAATRDTKTTPHPPG